jgi:hypothetical protein
MVMRCYHGNWTNEWLDGFMDKINNISLCVIGWSDSGMIVSECGWLLGLVLPWHPSARWSVIIETANDFHMMTFNSISCYCHCVLRLPVFSDELFHRFLSRPLRHIDGFAHLKSDDKSIQERGFNCQDYSQIHVIHEWTVDNLDDGRLGDDVRLSFWDEWASGINIAFSTTMM